MNWKCALLLFVVVAAMSLSSCSGLNSVCTDCTSGNANVTVTMFDTPPTGASVLSFSLPIVGISLTPSSGSPVSVYSPTTIVPYELTRLQSDSALVVSGATVATGTYTSLNITIAATSGVWVNASSSSISSCTSGNVCYLPAGAATTVAVPINLTLNNNQNQWIGIDVNLNNAITTTNGITVDFTLPNVFTATTTVRTGLPNGAVDTIEDFTGAVTALSNSSITVQNAITGQSLVAGITSSTGLSVVPPAYNTGCQSGNANTCMRVGSTVSLYANVAASGTLTATHIDLLDTTATDEIEGVIYPASTTAGIVGLILLDKTSASGNSVLAGSTFGTPFQLDATTNGVTFNVDSGPLTNSGFSTNGFTSTGGLLAGQVIRVQVTNVKLGSNNINTATAANVLLRWSRFSANINTSGTAPSLTNYPVYMSSSGPFNSNSGVPVNPQAGTYQGYTAFDGITDSSGLTVGTQTGWRALFLSTTQGAQYSFQAAKVRVP